MTGTEKVDAAVGVYLASAIGLSLTDLNAWLTAVALAAGIVLAILRIARLIKHWHHPPTGK